MIGPSADSSSRFAPGRSLRRYVLGVSTAWLLVAGVAQAQPAIERALESALTSLPHAGTVVGACVIDLSSGSTVYSHNEDAPLIPASNMKVFVMAAALLELGPDFAFETILATDRTNLIVIGDGDPAFGDAKLCRQRGESIEAVFQRFAAKLLAAGVDQLGGDIIIDDSVFEDRWTHPSWEKADLGKWYAAPVGGLNYHDNCVAITVSPGDATGTPVRVSAQPETSVVLISNTCRSGGKGTPLLHHPHDSFEYRISGRCSKRWPFGPVAFPDPGLLLADSFRTVLVTKGIHVAGRIRRGRLRRRDGTVPASLTIVDRHTTPLADVLRRTGKDSQNLFAECLLKRIAYAWAQRVGVRNPQGSWEVGSEAIVDVLGRAGIDTAGLVVADGSGLSRTNRCSARQLVSVLSMMYARREGELFRNSLSIAGVDGKLRKRLKDLPGRVRGKTGTMRGIRTLSAYVDGGSAGPYALAILFNGYTGPSTPYKEIQDRLCRVLAGAASSGDTR